MRLSSPPPNTPQPAEAGTRQQVLYRNSDRDQTMMTEQPPPIHPSYTNQPTNQPTNHHHPKSPQRLVTAACSAPSRQRARETGERERENGATEQPPPQYTPARRSRNPTAGFIPQQRPRSNHDRHQHERCGTDATEAGPAHAPGSGRPSTGCGRRCPAGTP